MQATTSQLQINATNGLSLKHVAPLNCSLFRPQINESSITGEVLILRLYRSFRSNWIAQLRGIREAHHDMAAAWKRVDARSVRARTGSSAVRRRGIEYS